MCSFPSWMSKCSVTELLSWPVSHGVIKQLSSCANSSKWFISAVAYYIGNKNGHYSSVYLLVLDTEPVSQRKTPIFKLLLTKICITTVLGIYSLNVRSLEGKNSRQQMPPRCPFGGGLCGIKPCLRGLSVIGTELWPVHLKLRGRFTTFHSTLVT